MTFRSALAVGLLAGGLALPAAGQEPPVDLEAWSYEAIAPGWRASALIDHAVTGEGDAELGSVGDIIIGATGRIAAVTVETDGARYAVPWSEIDYDPAAETAALPIGPDELDRFQPVAEQALDGTQNRPDTFLASQLVGQSLAVEDEQEYGRVTDLIFGAGGTLEAVVLATADRSDKRVALPWTAVRLDPEGGLLTAPYRAAELDRLEPLSDGDAGRQTGGSDATR